MKPKKGEAVAGHCLALALVAALLLGGMCPSAQAQEPVHVSINDVDSEGFPKVVAYATVLSATGHSVVELPPGAFSLAEDGRPVTDFAVDLLENAGEPILLALALDTSGSMKGQPLKDTKAAAIRLIRDLGPADQIAVLSFGDLVTTHEGLTADKAAASAAVEALAVQKWTTLHDGIHAGVKLLEAQPRGRKALVVLTDGDDTTSEHTMAEGIAAAKASSVPVYAIGFGPDIKPGVLGDLAGSTGGHFYQKPSSDEIDESFQAVARLLRYQYVFDFESSLPADDAEHSLEIAVKVDGVEASDQARFAAKSGEVDVSMIFPATGDTVGGLVTLKARTDSPGEVVQVEYLLDGVPLEVVTTGGFAYDWDASNVPLGEHTLTLIVTDSAGNEGQTDLTVTVAHCVEVASIAPTDGQLVSGTVPVQARVSALTGLAQVILSVDGSEIDTATAAPWDLIWDAGEATTGRHTLTLTAYDAKSQAAEASQEVWVGLRLGMPDLSDGDTVGGLTTLAPVIEAPGDVTQVEFLLDGELLETVTSADFSYVWDSTGVPVGEHTLTVRVADNSGNEKEMAFTLNVVEPVAVAFVSPAEEERERLGGEVDVEVEVASVADVDRVEFAVDGQVMETISSEPYRFSWNTKTIATGPHELRATAYDVKGQSDQASLDTWVAFRGSKWGLWLALVVAAVAVGLAIPLARRRRQKMETKPTPAAQSAVSPPTEPEQAFASEGTTPAVAWLVVEQGPEAGSRWPLPQGETRLGRTRSANDVVIPSRTASRRHASIRAEAGDLVYYDIEPTNPTLINSTPIAGSHELNEGDRIQIGDSVLRFTKEE